MINPIKRLTKNEAKQYFKDKKVYKYLPKIGKVMAIVPAIVENRFRGLPDGLIWELGRDCMGYYLTFRVV